MIKVSICHVVALSFIVAARVGRRDVDSVPAILEKKKEEGKKRTVPPIAGHILTDNLHSRRTDTGRGRPRGLA